jgi:hypothetical protein
MVRCVLPVYETNTYLFVSVQSLFWHYSLHP